jgi:hypothetical protein
MTTSTTTTSDGSNILVEVTQALEAANAILPDLLAVIGAVWSPAASLAKFLPLINTALEAVQIVGTATGGTAAASTQAVSNQLTPGQPSAPALN